MPVTNIHSRWDSGNLIFHESTSLATIADILKLGTTMVTVGSETNDIDFKIWMGSSAYALFDYGAELVTFSGLAVTIAGDLIISAEDISVIQGKYIYLDGQGGGEYVISDTAGDLMLNATTNLNLAIGGTDEVRLTATVFSPATTNGNALGSATLMWSDLFLADVGVINWNNGDTTLTATGNLLTLGASGFSVGASGAGFDVIFYGDTADCNFFWDQNLDTNGTLVLGTTGGAKGVDLIVYGDTNGNYLHWDRSADDLLLVGTATQLAVAGTAAATTAATGSLRTAGGLGVAGAGWFGGDIFCNDAAGPTLQNEAATTTNPTLIPNRADETTGIGWNTAQLVGVVSGAAVVTLAAATVTFAQKIIQDDTTASTDTVTGSIQTDGGLGVAGAAFFGGLVTSVNTTGFRSNPTFVPDATRTNYAYCVGNRVTALDITMATQANYNLDPIQLNLNIIGTAPTSSTVNGIYQLITLPVTTAMPNLRLKCSDWTIVANNNFQDAYVSQNELDIVGNVTIAGEAFAVSAYLNAGTGTYTVNDRLAALFAITSGTATVTGTYNVAHFFASANSTVDNILQLETISTANITAGMEMLLDGTVTYAMDFQGTVSDGWTSGSAAIAHANSNYALIPVRITGVGVTLYLLAGETWS